MRRAALLVAGVTAFALLGCGEGAASGTKGSAGGAAGRGPVNGGAGSTGVAGGAGRMNGGASGAGAGGASASGAGGGGASGGSSAGAAGNSSGGAGTTGASGGVGGAGGTSAGASATAGSTAAGGTASGAAGTGGEGGAAPSGPLSVLVFSRTQGFRHDSIPDGIAAFTKLATAQGWTLSASEDPGVFAEATLERADVVVFLSTTGDILDDAQQAAFERFIRAGGGFVGVHSATDTEYDWAFYGELVGAYFREHPAIQEATVVVEDGANAILAGIPSRWTRTDEWYAFKTNPRPNVHVLMTLDESSYEPGTSAMGADHPITWLHEYEGGRAFYTALGHTTESYADPVFVGMLERAVEWAAGG